MTKLGDSPNKGRKSMKLRSRAVTAVNGDDVPKEVDDIFEAEIIKVEDLVSADLNIATETNGELKNDEESKEPELSLQIINIKSEENIVTDVKSCPNIEISEQQDRPCCSRDLIITETVEELNNLCNEKRSLQCYEEMSDDDMQPRKKIKLEDNTRRTCTLL